MTQSPTPIALMLALATAACGGGGGSSSDGGASTDGGGRDVARPPVGEWEQAWSEDAGNVRCGAPEADFEGLTSLTFGDATIYVGYDQASGDNQNPVVARFDDGEPTWCVSHETQPPDGRALGLTWDGGDHAYVVYSVVGGGTDLEGHGGWLDSYAPGAISGGGAKVSYLGRVDASDGSLVGGSFVIAVLSSGKVNTHAPAGAPSVLEDGAVELYGSSAHKPIDADGATSMDCTDYPFDSRYRFSADLGSLVCADCSNCVSERPCD